MRISAGESWRIMVGRLGRVFAGRGWRFAAAGATAALGLAAFAVSHAATAAAELLKIRVGGAGAETRLVLDLASAASARVVSDGAADRRVVIMMPGVTAPPGLQGAGRGVVKAWMVDQPQGGARLSMDLAGDGQVKRRFLLPPADGVDHY